jgi:hypothetical protein
MPDSRRLRRVLLVERRTPRRDINGGRLPCRHVAHSVIMAYSVLPRQSTGRKPHDRRPHRRRGEAGTLPNVVRLALWDAVPANAHHELRLTVRTCCPGGSRTEASVRAVARAVFSRLEIASDAIPSGSASRANCSASRRQVVFRLVVWLRHTTNAGRSGYLRRARRVSALRDLSFSRANSRSSSFVVASTRTTRVPYAAVFKSVVTEWAT